jgi:hypothetical protein
METDSGEVRDPEDGRSAVAVPTAGKASVDVAADYGGNTFPVDGAVGCIVTVTRAAGVERRNGFAVRSKALKGTTP